MWVPLDEMHRLVGCKFPGGSYTIERWENVLVNDITGFPPLDQGFAPPIYSFNAPLAAVGMAHQQVLSG